MTHNKFPADQDEEFSAGSKISTISVSNRTRENLAILGIVWGFLKYYHPSIAKGDYNWDYELFRILPKILDAKYRAERNSILSGWVKSLGKVLVRKGGKHRSSGVKIIPDLVWIDSSILGNDLYEQLTAIRNVRRTNNHYYIGLVPGIGNPEFKNETPYITKAYPDAGYRLLSLFRFWNIIQYYFPNKHLIQENWHAVLREYIPTFLNASNELEYKLAVLALIARIHDTHANIWKNDAVLNDYKGVKIAPVKVSFIEHEAVVTDYYDQVLGKKSGLMIGDVIETINGKSVDEIVRRQVPFAPASNYPTQLRDIAKNLLRTNDSSLTLGFTHNNIPSLKRVECFIYSTFTIHKEYLPGETCFKLLQPNIAYVFPGSIRNTYLPKIMPKVLKTKGLIIDLRSYPSDFIVLSLCEYLLPRKKDFVKFSTGSITSPGLFTLTKNTKAGRKNTHFYKGKVVIIVNENTQSQGEYTAMALRTAPRATVIGSTTAGADGNISFFYLPGGIRTAISGIGVYYPNGKETQRVGIVPDIEVKPTIKGIREDRDELLEKAIEIINKE